MDREPEKKEKPFRVYSNFYLFILVLFRFVFFFLHCRRHKQTISTNSLEWFETKLNENSIWKMMRDDDDAAAAINIIITHHQNSRLRISVDRRYIPNHHIR